MGLCERGLKEGWCKSGLANKPKESGRGRVFELQAKILESFNLAYLMNNNIFLSHTFCCFFSLSNAHHIIFDRPRLVIRLCYQNIIFFYCSSVGYNCPCQEMIQTKRVLTFSKAPPPLTKFVPWNLGEECDLEGNATPLICANPVQCYLCSYNHPGQIQGPLAAPELLETESSRYKRLSILSVCQ